MGFTVSVPIDNRVKSYVRHSFVACISIFILKLFQHLHLIYAIHTQHYVLQCGDGWRSNSTISPCSPKLSISHVKYVSKLSLRYMEKYLI